MQLSDRYSEHTAKVHGPRDAMKEGMMHKQAAAEKATVRAKRFVPMTHETANYELLLAHGSLSDVLTLAAILNNRSQS